MSKSIARAILELFVRPRAAGLLCASAALISPLTSFDWLAPATWAGSESRWDESTDLAAARQLMQAGNHTQALIVLQQLRKDNATFAQNNDVDFLIATCAERAGHFQLAWDAAKDWRAAQPASTFADHTQSSEPIGLWSGRREMAAKIFLTQIKAAYQLALLSLEPAGQQQWLSQAEATCRELRGLQPADEYLQPLDYHTNMIALQQELRRTGEAANSGDAQAANVRLEQLRAQFRATADRATALEWKHNNLYYEAVTAEMAGNAEMAIKLWGELHKDLQAPDEIRRKCLSAMAEANLSRWFVANQNPPTTESEKVERRQWLVDARDRFLQMQSEFPVSDAARVAFNLGMCFRMLDDHSQAILQFEKIQWPTQPDVDLATACLSWQAQLNQARSLYALRQFESAGKVLDAALPRLNFATDSGAGMAVLLRMRIAEQAEDWPLILALGQQGESWLRAVPNDRAELDYLIALAQFQSSDQSLKAEGAKSLASIAGQPNHPWTDLAKFRLLPYQVEGASTRHSSSRITFESSSPDLKDRWQAAVKTAEELLSSPLLKADNFPVNPAVLTDEQREVLERRKQVRLWQAKALFQAGDLAQAVAKFGELLKEFPGDSAAPEWTMKRAVGVASVESPARALEELTEPLLKTWPIETQAEGWFVRGEFLRLNKEELAAVKAYEKSTALAKEPETKKMAIEAGLSLLNRLSDSAEIVRLINSYEKEFAGAMAISLTLQRGVANFQLKNFASAEADFSRVLTLAATTTPIDESERKLVAGLIADAQVNLGLAMSEQGKSTEAKAVWEDFLAKHAEHEYRVQVTDWLRKIDPKWQATEPQTEVAETSGTTIESLDERYELAHEAFEQKQWAKAAEGFASLVEVAKADPRHDDVLYFLGWSLREQNKIAEAKLAWEQLLAQHLQSSWAGRTQFHLGEADYHAGDFARAAERFQMAKTAATDPSLQRSSIYMEAWSELNLQKFDSAKQKFQSIIDGAKVDESELPLVLEAHALVGQCNFKAGKMPEAMAAFQSATTAIEKLKTVKRDMYFQACLSAGRAAIEVDKAADALPWLNNCIATIEEGNLPESIDDKLQNEAKFLLGVARRLTKDFEGATRILSTLANRPDAIGMSSLMELALVARTRGDERTAQRHYTAVANGAYGNELSKQAIEWKAQSQLEMGLSLLRSANQQTDPVIRMEYLRQAKTWLTRAQLQNDSTVIADQATQQLEQMRRLGL
ncbi:MAG: tetratricopeptide repeat protein [Planctomycetaceae bacterium]|nr:tetratricopeptide repeat protein [Planctomycetaceae bacterium]